MVIEIGVNQKQKRQKSKKNAKANKFLKLKELRKPKKRKREWMKGFTDTLPVCSVLIRMIPSAPCKRQEDMMPQPQGKKMLVL